MLLLGYDASWFEVTPSNFKEETRNNANMTQNTNNLIWIDLEMTGLDTANDVIIEIATIVTDGELNILAQGPVFAINQPSFVMKAMDEWNTKQHGKSGLTERVLNSVTTAQQAETATIKFLEQYVAKAVSPMCGNSICQDRRFMARLMPDLEDYFLYRNLDVSTIKELAKRWSPKVSDGVKKQGTHLAMADIVDSIDELKHYRDNFFILAK
ncbi:3'-to-5' oligoribonuclease (orn) [hydrothermal vent metagenome]|uniref:3'-to-5' oligoribonuclease (Orn) n=1 Tax=hydrothermal vent metagenome TaxID=652676 RepID=A0A3B0ZHI4_9ZZZZ